MDYEEKLDLLIKALIEARKSARTGHHPKLFYTAENGLKRFQLEEIYDLLLKLQDDDKILSIVELPTDLLSSIEHTYLTLTGPRKYFVIEVKDTFDPWLNNRLLKRKSVLEGMDYINILKIYDVCLDINEKLQLADSPTIFIPSLPLLVKFQILFPVDSIGSRKKYQDYRWEGLKYLQHKGIVDEPDFYDDVVGYGNIEITVDLLKFESFLEEITAEYQKRNKAVEKEEARKSAPKSAPVPTPKKQPPLHYDTKSGTLVIGDKKVKLRADAFRNQMLELLLRDEASKKRIWNWDEIIEKLEGIDDEDELKARKKKFYPACEGLSASIAKKTGINDLLIYDNNTIHVNSKYLETS